jgi:exo-rhamnogalacturonan lyase-like protein
VPKRHRNAEGVLTLTTGFHRLLTTGCILAALTASAAGLEVKLIVRDDARTARKPGTITSGVPFAKGAVKDLAKLSVSSGGTIVPAQFTKLVSWDDGSVRWALLDAQVELPAGGKTELTVRDTGTNKPPAAPVKVADSAAAVTVSTGSLTVVIDKKKPGLIQSITVAGKELVTGAGRGAVLYAAGDPKQVQKKRGRRTYTVTEYGPGKQVPAGPPSEVVVERAGPLRAMVRVRGKFPGVHNGLLTYTARISVFAGQKFVKVHFWLENNGGMGYYFKSKKNKGPGKMEWLLFDGMALEFGLGGAPRAACEGSAASAKFKLLQVCHRNKAKAKLRYNNYLVYQLKDFEYTITGDGKQLKKGVRTDGAVELSGAAGKTTVAIRNFWENYEKAIELADSKLKLWLWPTEGTWPRPGPRFSAGLFDKQLQAAPRPGLYYLQGGTHKGHEFILDFSGRAASESRAELSQPLFALAPAEYYAGTAAAPVLFAPPKTRTGDDECNQKLDAWMRMTLSVVDPQSKSGLVAARKDSPWTSITYFGDSAYWYGWMDFGDIAVPGRGPAGLGGDWLLVMMMNAMRTGNIGFLRMGTEMARHRIDIDQLWSDRDPPSVNGLLRAGGFPAFHCYRLYRPPSVRSNHMAGTALYYMLTGEPKALEVCKRNAEGLKRSWAHIAKTRPWAGPQGDMSANAAAIHSYLAMSDLTAEEKWIEEALALFRRNVAPKAKALGPHMHSRQQIRSQGYTKDDIRYCHSIYALCLLQHYSQDKQLLELLKAGAKKDFPENYFDAPLFLADLHAYVALKTGKSDYADDAVEHWIEASSESKCPPVYQGKKNSIWPGRAVMHLRAGHLLQYYFWKKNGKK